MGGGGGAPDTIVSPLALRKMSCKHGNKSLKKKYWA